MRTVLRSSKGKKLYAVRDAKGHFKDIQSYKRAHAADLRHTAKGEKRQRLIDYITAFYIEAENDSVKYNKAWAKLWKKIDKLSIV